MNMLTKLLKITSSLRKEQVGKKKGVSVITVGNSQEGMELAKDLLYKGVDDQTLLLLSGGSQKTLYEMLAQEKRLKPLAVGLVDERYGEKMHDNSNEKMIRETGLVSYLESRGIKFYPVLNENAGIEDTSERYEQVLRNLLANSKKRIAICGIGPDGHTSGIAPSRPDFINPLFTQQGKLVGWFDDATGNFKKRVTTTFEALSQMDLLIILAFGSGKQDPLKKMFVEGSLEEIPSRFYIRPDIAPKTLLITDQKM